MQTGNAISILMAAAILGHPIAAASEATGNYATDLATVYGGYQHLLAMKEACDTAVPAARSANDKAFSAWQARQHDLIQELQRRVTAMIRLASQDEKEYARNLGKYEGAIVQERQAYKQTLLELAADDLLKQCRRVPEMLKSPDADLGKVYAPELAVIRKRK